MKDHHFSRLSEAKEGETMVLPLEYTVFITWNGGRRMMIIIEIVLELSGLKNNLQFLHFVEDLIHNAKMLLMISCVIHL